MSGGPKKPCAICGTKLIASDLAQHETKCFGKIQSKVELHRKSKQKSIEKNEDSEVSKSDAKNSIKKTQEMPLKTIKSAKSQSKSSHSNKESLEDNSKHSNTNKMVSPREVIRHTSESDEKSLLLETKTGSDEDRVDIKIVKSEFDDIHVNNNKAESSRESMKDTFNVNTKDQRTVNKNISSKDKVDNVQVSKPKTDIKQTHASTDSDVNVKSDEAVQLENDNDENQKSDSKSKDKEILENTPYPSSSNEKKTVCGSRYRSDKVDKHEKSCRQNKVKSHVPSKDDQKTNAYLKEIPNNNSLEENSSADFNEEFENNRTSNETKVKQSVSSRPSVLQSDLPDMLRKEKEEMVKTPYPSSSNINVVQQDYSSPDKLSLPRSRPSLKPGDNAKQAWNANATRRLSAVPEPPQPTKKYRYYPISCEFCGKAFQPGPLRKHVREKHPDAHMPPHLRGKDIGKMSTSDKSKSLNSKKTTRKSPGPRFKVCYICGRQFGSKSLPIHEPKCLEKWRIQNDQLPKDKRMPEPVKPQVISGSVPSQQLSENKSYSEQLPELNAENKAAYESHLKNLVPCSHCGRRFNPDRVMVHEGACIERPKKRTYKTPEDKQK